MRLLAYVLGLLVILVILGGGLADAATTSNDYTTAEKKKIAVTFDFCSNYIFHMLSVAQCGYDNEYGKCYRSVHLKSQLELLNRNKDLLTNVGGEHSGKLYYVMVILPAGYFGEDYNGLKNYYELSKKVFQKKYTKETKADYQLLYRVWESYGNKLDLDYLTDNLDTFYSKQETVAAIALCDIFEENVDVYKSKVWNDVLTSAAPKIKQLAQYFAENNCIYKYESVCKAQYPYESFTALMVVATQGGSDAIDVAKDKDVFCLETTPEVLEERYISHEVCVYILRNNGIVLEGNNQQKSWLGTESLASFYQLLVMGKLPKNPIGSREVIDFYQAEYNQNPNASCRDLYQSYLKKY